MNASKFFVSSIVAASVVSVIGIAYAQTSSTTSPTGRATAPELQNRTTTQGAPMDSSNRSTTGTINTPSTDTTRDSGTIGTTRDNSTSGSSNSTSGSGSTMSRDGSGMGSGMDSERAARADRN
ncbi:MAG: hypothetical protein Q8R98_00030 [Rubrivivax sp.]|nr:hypothetical protein [Rubrivivax sp.]MDP3610217.1 hypothetical protein [Rubrivivax sp.]